MFVKTRSKGGSFNDFLGMWYMHDQISNDSKAVRLVRQMIDRELHDDIDGREGQKSISHRAFRALNDV